MIATAGTIVDSSVLLDLFTEDVIWLAWSQARLVEAAERGALVLNAVVLAEIAARFSRIEMLRAALPSMCLIGARAAVTARSQDLHRSTGVRWHHGRPVTAA